MGTELTNVPHRIFYGFKHCLDDDLTGGGIAKANHSAVFSPHCYLGYAMNGGWSHWWWGLARPTDPDWGLVSGADEVVDFWWYCNIALISNTTANTHFHLRAATTDHTNAENVDPDVATGQIYKSGVGGDWTAYPAFGHEGSGADVVQVNLADLPKDYILYGESYHAGATDWFDQDSFIRSGWNGRMHALNVGDPGAGQHIKVEATFSKVLVRYHNPCVNALSKVQLLAAGGEPLVLSGLGFYPPDADITNAALNPVNWTPIGGWDSWVTDIQVVNAPAGTVAATLNLGLAEFTIDSNGQITIPAMPALADGAYWLRLIKGGAQLHWIITAGTNPSGYAGDWRTDADGLMTVGDRWVIMVGKKVGPIVPITDWTFKHAGVLVHRYYAPIDIESPLTFYNGKILSISPINRGVSSGYGLFLSSDCTIVLSNADREFSSLMYDHWLRNQSVKIFYAWLNAPHAWKKAAALMLGENTVIRGPEFTASLRDVSTKYFSRKVPLYRCTADEFPNIQEQAVNRPKPEILGKHEYTEAQNGGAIEAVYVDTVNFAYLAARGEVHDITEVYADGVAAAPADWSWAVDGSGHSIITFVADQGDKRITFDAEGYEYLAWNSANGYVQNPAYIMEFFLAFLCDVPDLYLDLISFDDLAAKFVTLGIDEAGKMALQKEEESENVLKGLLYTFGTYSAFDRDGRFFVDRKDYSSLIGAKTIWAAIDMLDHPEKDFATATAFNRMRARWDYAPAPDVYSGGFTWESGLSIAVLEEEIESPTTPDFPYTNSAAWVEDRCQEDLCRWGYGSAEFRFELPLEFYDQIELLDNVMLQDIYGVEQSGLGEAGHYAFIERIELDLQNRKLAVYCADLQYLLTCMGSGTSGMWSHVF